MTHEMVHIETVGGKHRFVCPECGRDLYLGPDGLSVVEPGEFAASHHGGSISVSAEVGQ